MCRTSATKNFQSLMRRRDDKSTPPGAIDARRRAHSHFGEVESVAADDFRDLKPSNPA
jgi:hypothetical protein